MSYLFNLNCIMENPNEKKKRKIAVQQYLNSKDKSRYVALAQKLAQHINNLSEDKNARTRWIWELIQNAKDVPNEFGKCKIRVEIQDDKLIFRHNGDPFKVLDLQSLATQYSSKSEENKVQKETTGKYGTGFITTYILSKIVNIKGLLVMDDIDSEEEENKKGEENQRKEQVNRIEKNEKVNEEDDVFELTQEVIKNSQKVKRESKNQKNQLYQRFSIMLDRSYKDRDKELVDKLFKTEQYLIQNLSQNEPKPKWQRDVNELNTQFTYQSLDQAAFKMIDEAMACIKVLFPYALLFNPKLEEFHVIDHRKGKKISNFTIKKLQETQFNGLKIFNAKIIEQGKENSIFSAAFMEDVDTYSMLATPVEIKQGSMKLLETNQKFPKMFKQFPLIGCRDHGFNFVFTSKGFYPNETRSELLLNQIDGRFCPKAKSNWESLNGIFTKGLEMYKRLAETIKEGQQNLLIVSVKNQFTNEEIQNNLIYKTLASYKEEISKIKFIELKNGHKGMLTEIVLSMGKSQKNDCSEEQYSSLLNANFSEVIGQNKTLPDSLFKKFYPKIRQYMETWKYPTVKIIDVRGCLSQLSKNTFKMLKKKVGQDQAFDILEQIYAFLFEHDPKYITQGFNQEDAENYSKLAIILTNKEELTNLNSNINGHKLMLKEDLPKAYDEIAQQTGIDTDDYTIFDDFAQYFKKVKPFGIPEMLSLYRTVFFVNYVIYPHDKQKENMENRQKIILLGRMLTTFKIKSKSIQFVSKLKYFENANTPFRISDKQSQLTMNSTMKLQYKYLFELKVVRYINGLMEQKGTLASLMSFTTLKDKNEAIKWLNQIFKNAEQLFLDEKTQIVQYKAAQQYAMHSSSILYSSISRIISQNLTLSQKFVNRSSLSTFVLSHQCDEQGNYPDEEDLAFYKKIINPYQSLEDRVVHSQIHDQLGIGITFEDKFKCTVQEYHHKDTPIETKVKILNYVYHLRQQAKQNPSLEYKIKVFKDIETSAHYMYPCLSSCIKDKEHQIYVHHLVRNLNEIDASIELNEEFGSLNQALEELRKNKRKQRKELKKKQKQQA